MRKLGYVFLLACAQAESPDLEWAYETTDSPLVSQKIGATQFINVALSANGGVASASSEYPAGGGASSYAKWANDGVREANHNAAYWNDNTSSVFPDWLQVSFAGVKTIEEIDVFSLQDNYNTTNVHNLTATETGSQFVLRDFRVQYCPEQTWCTASSGWEDVPGGVVTTNNLIWKKFSFVEPIRTDRIRVYVTAVAPGYPYTVMAEVEAWEKAVPTDPCLSNPANCAFLSFSRVSCYTPNTATTTGNGYTYSDSAGSSPFSGVNHGSYVTNPIVGKAFTSLTAAQQGDIKRFLNNAAMNASASSTASNLDWFGNPTLIQGVNETGQIVYAYRKWFPVDSAHGTDYLAYWNSAENCAYLMTNKATWQGPMVNIYTKYFSGGLESTLGFPKSHFMGTVWGVSWQRFTNGYITNHSLGSGDSTFRAYYVGGTTAEKRALAVRYSMLFDTLSGTTTTYPLAMDQASASSLGFYVKTYANPIAETVVARTGWARAYSVGGRIGGGTAGWYAAYGATPWATGAGFPLSDEINTGLPNGSTVQLFEKGAGLWQASTNCGGTLTEAFDTVAAKPPHTENLAPMTNKSCGVTPVVSQCSDSQSLAITGLGNGVSTTIANFNFNFRCDRTGLSNWYDGVAMTWTEGSSGSSGYSRVVRGSIYTQWSQGRSIDAALRYYGVPINAETCLMGGAVASNCPGGVTSQQFKSSTGVVTTFYGGAGAVGGFADQALASTKFTLSGDYAVATKQLGRIPKGTDLRFVVSGQSGPWQWTLKKGAVVVQTNTSTLDLTNTTGVDATTDYSVEIKCNGSCAFTLTVTANMSALDRFAPVVYADTSSCAAAPGSEYPLGLSGCNEAWRRRDYLIKMNYDGDVNSSNNQANIDNTSIPARGNVYYDTHETATHRYFAYSFYHAIDWQTDEMADDGGHPNDFEGILVTTKKHISGQTEPLLFGRIVTMTTHAHHNYYTFAETGAAVAAGSEDIDAVGIAYEADTLDEFAAGHPKVYVQPGGHGVVPCGYTSAGASANCDDESGLVYRRKSNGLAETPGVGGLPTGSGPFDPFNAVGYGLIAMNEATGMSLVQTSTQAPEATATPGPWAMRKNTSTFKISDNAPAITDQWLTGGGANTPMAWDDEDDGANYRGEWGCAPQHMMAVRTTGADVDANGIYLKNTCALSPLNISYGLSYYNSDNANASAAFDRNPSSVFTTTSSANPYVEVRLPYVGRILGVFLANTNGQSATHSISTCTAWDATGACIYYSTTHTFTSLTTTGSYFDIDENNVGKTDRVRIQLSGSGQLKIGEIQVIGY